MPSVPLLSKPDYISWWINKPCIRISMIRTRTFSMISLCICFCLFNLALLLKICENETKSLDCEIFQKSNVDSYLNKKACMWNLESSQNLGIIFVFTYNVMESYPSQKSVLKSSKTEVDALNYCVVRTPIKGLEKAYFVCLHHCMAKVEIHIAAIRDPNHH